MEIGIAEVEFKAKDIINLVLVQQANQKLKVLKMVSDLKLETDNSMKGYVLSNTADACVQFRKNDKALKYYAEAVKNYEKTNAVEEIAQNYKSAAQIMIDFQSPNKAKSLLKKALVNAVKTHNDDLIAEINTMLASVES